MSKEGLVYFIASSEPARCKIGFTAGDPNKRLAALQSGSPAKLGIYCAFKGTIETEKLFHRTFAPLRIHGEWFDVKLKLLDFMICIMDAALSRREASWNDVLEAVEMVILANEPFKETDDKDEYLGSVDTQPWEWMRIALAEQDAEIEAERATVQ